jgi:membrane protein required for colicin V production
VNYFDIILLVPIVWGAYKGFTKGLIIEIASLVGLVLGLYLGVNFSYYAANLLKEHTELDQQFLPIIAFGITFLGVVFLVFLIGKIVEKIANFIALKMINKIAGACFGILKYGLIFSALLFVFDTIDKQFHLLPEEQKENSKLYPLIQPLVPTIVPQIKDFDIMEQVKVELPEIEI